MKSLSGLGLRCPAAWLPVLAGLVAIGGIAVSPAASAVVLEPRVPGSECRDAGNTKVPGCTSKFSATFTIQAGTRREVRLTCPGNAAYFWNWSAQVSPGVHVTLEEIVTGQRGRDLGAVMALHEQTGVAQGQARVVLGCSARPWAGQARMQHHGNHPVER